VLCPVISVALQKGITQMTIFLGWKHAGYRPAVLQDLNDNTLNSLGSRSRSQTVNRLR
jgi:hypothetical protein